MKLVSAWVNGLATIVALLYGLGTDDHASAQTVILAVIGFNMIQASMDG